MTDRALRIDDLTGEIDKATSQEEQRTSLFRLKGFLRAHSYTENEAAAVKFLLQQMVALGSEISSTVQEILSDCSPLLVWEIALETLQTLARQPSSSVLASAVMGGAKTEQIPHLTVSCLETTLKTLLRLLFFAIDKLPFVVRVVSTTFPKELERRREILTQWIQSVLRLPLIVANACEKKNLGLPRVWMTASNDRGFYFRLLKQAMDSTLRHAAQPQDMTEEYSLLLMASLIQQRGETETTVRVCQTYLDRTTESSKRLLSLVSFLSKHFLSPRQSAALWNAFWQCSRSSAFSSWGMSFGQVLLVSCAKQDAAVREILYNSPTTTETEVHALVEVLLSLEKTENESDEDSDDDIVELPHPEEWTYGQQLLARHATLVARQWSSRSYIRQTDPQLQVWSGKFLEIALCKLKGIDLSAPLVLHIVDGVSPRLESLQTVVRQSGMRVAEAMAQNLGQDLSFDELRRDPPEQPRPQERQNIRGGSAVKTTESHVQKSDRRVRKPIDLVDGPIVGGEDRDKNGTYSDETDDESVWNDGDEEFQPYGLDDNEEDLRETARPTYLRDCLDLLRTPESEDFARSHHEAALQGLPGLVRVRPMDLVDVAPSLAMQVLRMENKFNFDGFDDMITSCLVALVVEQPMSVGETLIDEIFRDGSLADRLKALDSLGQGAYELSGYKNQGKRQAALESTQRILNTCPRMKSRRRFVPGTAADTASSERTRRWGKNSVAKQVVNQFATVAPMWFYALLGNFLKRREDPVLWGGAVGSMLISKLMLTLAMIVELSGRGRSVEAMAKDLFDCVWGFHQAEVAEVRIAALCAVTSAISNMQDDLLFQILVDERAHSLSLSLKQIVMQDPDNECRYVAATVAKNVAHALESMGPLLMPATSN